MADTAWVEGRELRQDVAVVVEDGVVRDIVSSDDLEGAKDSTAVFNTRLLLPGFINAHCHLEYTSFLGKLPRGVPFAEWVTEITALNSKTPTEAYADGAREGIKQLCAGGTTTVIDSAHQPGAIKTLREGQIRGYVFREVLGLSEERAESSFGNFLAAYKADRSSPNRLSVGFGLNPHAPYSVGPGLRRRIKEFLTKNPKIACAWHLAEMAEEMQMFAEGAGGLTDFFRSAKLQMPFESVPKCTPVEFLKREDLFDRCDMAFHFNFPGKGEEGLFAALRAVVHCPGTHAYFKRETFPMWGLLEAGANVCLGTDSLASADTLSMFETLRMAGRSFPWLGGSQLLDLATRNAARAKPLASHTVPLGVIKRGAAADFVAVDPGKTHGWDLRETLLAPDAKVTGTFVGGVKVY